MCHCTKATSCEVKPDGGAVIAEGKSFILSCHFNLPPKLCAWYHNSPDSTSKSRYDLTCIESRDGSGTITNKPQKCLNHPRIAYGAAKHSGSMGGSRRMVSKKKMSKKQRMRIKKEEKRMRLEAMEENKNCVLRVAATSAEDAGEWRLDAMSGPSKHNKKPVLNIFWLY